MKKKRVNRLGIQDSSGELEKNHEFLPPTRKRLGTISNILDPESLYDPKRKKARTLQNLVDYREFIKRK